MKMWELHSGQRVGMTIKMIRRKIAGKGGPHRRRFIPALAAAGIAVALLFAIPAWAGPIWNMDGSGNWEVNNNWTPTSGYPDGAGQIATFGNVITTNRKVTVNNGVTVGSIIIDDNNKYTISSKNSNRKLTLDATGSADATITINNTNGNGAHTINAYIILYDNLDVTQNSSGTFTLASTITENGGAKSLTKDGSGVLLLTRSGYSGATTINAGTLRLGGNVLPGTGAVTVGGGTLDIQGYSPTVGAVTLTSGSITGSGGVLTGSSYAMQSGTVNAILGGTGVTLTKTTADTVVLSGANTYSGVTTIVQGILRLTSSGSIANSPTIDVRSGGTFDVSAYNSYTLAAGKTLKGSGTIIAPSSGAGLVISGTVSPGASPGTQTVTGNVTWAPGGKYTWEVDKVTSPHQTDQSSLQGVDPGFDTITISSTLDITATALNPFIIDIWGLTHSGGHVEGAVENWDVDQAEHYDWVIASAANITNFDPSKFLLDDTHFASNNKMNEALGGKFEIRQGGNQIVLGFVPEPATRVFIALGGLTRIFHQFFPVPYGATAFLLV